MGDAKGDPIGHKLTSHASSCKVCFGVFGVNPVDSLLSAWVLPFFFLKNPKIKKFKISNAKIPYICTYV